MNLTRRSFLKIMAVTAAVVMVPIQFPERKPPPKPLTYAELLHQKRKQAWVKLANQLEEAAWK